VGQNSKIPLISRETKLTFPRITEIKATILFVCSPLSSNFNSCFNPESLALFCPVRCCMDGKSANAHIFPLELLKSGEFAFEQALVSWLVLPGPLLRLGLRSPLSSRASHLPGSHCTGSRAQPEPNHVFLSI